jgi:hypothetical protein
VTPVAEQAVLAVQHAVFLVVAVAAVPHLAESEKKPSTHVIPPMNLHLVVSCSQQFVLHEAASVADVPQNETAKSVAHFFL